MEIQRPRRAPAVEKLVSEITKDDIRVRVFGTVSEVQQGLIILEDGTGKIGVDTPEKLEKGEKILVFGRPVETAEGIELQAEMVKDAPMLNEKLYKKAHILLSKGGLQ